MRGTIWGNPFSIGFAGTREEVIIKHRQWLLRQDWLLRRIGELRNKKLSCCCKPKACHGDTLSEFADMQERELFRLALEEVVDPSYIDDWLKKQNKWFGYRAPQELIDSNEFNELWDMIDRLRSGEPA